VRLVATIVLAPPVFAKGTFTVNNTDDLSVPPAMSVRSNRRQRLPTGLIFFVRFVRFVVKAFALSSPRRLTFRDNSSVVGTHG